MEKKYCTFNCKNVNLFNRKYIPRIGANVNIPLHQVDDGHGHGLGVLNIKNAGVG